MLVHEVMKLPNNLLAVFRIFPEDDQVDLDSLKEKIREAIPKGNENLFIYKITEEAIAFGIKVLRVFVVMPPVFEGGTQPLEEIFGKIKGVGQVDVEIVQTLPG